MPVEMTQERGRNGNARRNRGVAKKQKSLERHRRMDSKANAGAGLAQEPGFFFHWIWGEGKAAYVGSDADTTQDLSMGG